MYHFLAYKGGTHEYLLQVAIIHNKNQNPLLNLLINCMSTKLASQIWSLKDEHIFRFLNFLTIGLCIS